MRFSIYEQEFDKYGAAEDVNDARSFVKTKNPAEQKRKKSGVGIDVERRKSGEKKEDYASAVERGREGERTTGCLGG